MINYNKELANRILTELGKSTYSTLLNYQRYFIPQLIELDLELLTDGEYKYLEHTYKTNELLFRVKNPFNIKKDSFRKPYNGSMVDLLNNKSINPFLLYIDNEVIDPSIINLIIDDRYMYIEVVGYYTYDVFFGSYNIPTTLNGTESISIPKLGPEFVEGVNFELQVDDVFKVTSLNINGIPLQVNRTGDLIKSIIPQEMFTDFADSELNILNIDFNMAAVKYIKLNSVKNHRRAIHSNVRTLLLNMDVKYSDTVYNDNTIFILFNGMTYTANEYDMLPLSTGGTYINKINNDVYYLEGTADQMEDPFPEFIDYRFWKENFLVFKDNYLLYPNDLVKLFTEMGDLDSFINKNYIFKLFYNTTTNRSIDNAYKISPDRLDKYIVKKDFAHKLFELFDYSYDKSITEDSNITEMFRDIISYNSELINEYFDHFAFKKTITFTGLEIKNSSTLVDGMYKKIVSRNYNNTNENSALVYVNGYLYSEAYMIESPDKYTIMFESAELNDTDIIDVIFYLNTFNKKIKFKIADADEKRNINTFIPTEHLEIYSAYPVYQDFNLPINDDRQYRVDYNIYEFSPTEMTYLIDSDLYGKDMYMVSKRQFRRMQFIPMDYNLNVHRIYLSADFKFCQHGKQYSVYVNGKRLDNSMVVYIPHGESLPIFAHYVILQKRLEVGDTVDVIYTPDIVEEIHMPRLADSGLITFPNRDVLGFPISYKTIELFVNGKRITESEFKPISSIGLAVSVDIKSTYNVTIIKNINYNDDIFALYKTCTDIWSEYNKLLPVSSIKKLHGISETFTISNSDLNMKTNIFSKEMIYFEVLRKHWLEPLEVLDPSKYYNYSLNHSIAEWQEVPELDVDYIRNWSMNGASYEVGFNEKKFEYVDNQISHYVHKTSYIGEVVTMYRNMNLIGDNFVLSASAYVWVDCPYEDDIEAVNLRGIAQDGTTDYYLGSLKDKDGNSQLKNIPQKRWVRLHINAVGIPNYVKFLRLNFKLKSNGSKVHIVYGRFDYNKITESGTQVIRLDPAVTTINNLPF